MFHASLLQRLAQWLTIAALLGFGVAFAQAEPTLSQINTAAQSGQLDQAQLMIQQVLVAHPNSGKAHFVQAELFAKQGKSNRAAEALATAEKLAPGLPFAKPEAVQSLRTQIAAAPRPMAINPSSNRNVEQAAPASASASSSWGLPLLLTAGVMAFGYFFFRRKTAETFNAPVPGASPYNNPAPVGNGLSGPQAFGANGGNGAMQPAPGYGQPGYGQPAYGQPAAPGMGSRIMGGVATGLAVGAGVMAAQAIAKSFSGEHEGAHRATDDSGQNNLQPVPDNYDMGGQNMGLNDTSSWDDGGSVADSGGGGDWDS
jgi:uncharacterized protein